MATPRTETTELAVGFGLLGVHPLHTEHGPLSTKFEGTLTATKFSELQDTLRNDKRLKTKFDRLFDLGRRLKTKRPDLFPAVANVRWLGPVKQSRAVAASQDLMVGTTSISVKAESKVVFNLSPYNLFVSLPQGRVPAFRAPHWFLTQAPATYQRLFDVVSDATDQTSITEFERRANRSQRRALRAECDGLSGPEQTLFLRRYLEMCHETARVSAKKFREGLSATLKTVHASGVRDEILRTFFRLDSSQYVVCGLDRGQLFAFLIPSITEWKRGAELREVVAEPDLEAGQSQVLFYVDVRMKTGGERVRVPFHAEIRWSHGRFSGRPEAKLYRDFDDWAKVPGIERLL